MFVDLINLHIYDNEYDDEKANEDHFEKPWVVDMCELMRPNDTNMEKKKITTNLQVHPPPWKKLLFEWVT
jgi:hypothetical protein